MHYCLSQCGVPEIPYKNTAAIFLPHQGGVGRLGFWPWRPTLTPIGRKSARPGGRGGMEHPGGVRFTNQGLQARAAKSSLARPFMARSYFSSYFWVTILGANYPNNETISLQFMHFVHLPVGNHIQP